MEGHDRLLRLATYAAVGMAVLLIALKLAAWLGTGSVALLSTLIDSTLDAAASLVNLLAVRHSLTPADREHRFGHGKAEPLAGLAQSTFIAGSALFLIGVSVPRLFEPQKISYGLAGVAVMAVSILLTLGLVAFQRMVIKRTNSLAIAADHVHYKADVLMNLGVIAALLINRYLGWSVVDPLFALAIGGYILAQSAQIGWRSYNLLMDHEFPDEDRARIADICTSHPAVLAVHDIRTRSSGMQGFIQLHLELDGEMTLLAAHHVSDEVEAAIRAAFPAADVMIHQDPSGVEEHRADFALDGPPSEIGGRP